MLPSMGSQRIRHDLATEQQKSLRNMGSVHSGTVQSTAMGTGNCLTELEI